MAVITIMLSSVLGAAVGLFRLVVLDATAWQALMTYLAVSLILSLAIGIMALFMALLNGRAGRAAGVPCNDLEIWPDWFTEEEMKADRLREAGRHRVNAPRLARGST